MTMTLAIGVKLLVGVLILNETAAVKLEEGKSYKVVEHVEALGLKVIQRAPVGSVLTIKKLFGNNGVTFTPRDRTDMHMYDRGALGKCCELTPPGPPVRKGLPSPPGFQAKPKRPSLSDMKSTNIPDTMPLPPVPAKLSDRKSTSISYTAPPLLLSATDPTLYERPWSSTQGRTAKRNTFSTSTCTPPVTATRSRPHSTGHNNFDTPQEFDRTIPAPAYRQRQNSVIMITPGRKISTSGSRLTQGSLSGRPSRVSTVTAPGSPRGSTISRDSLGRRPSRHSIASTAALGKQSNKQEITRARLQTERNGSNVPTSTGNMRFYDLGNKTVECWNTGSKNSRNKRETINLAEVAPNGFKKLKNKKYELTMNDGQTKYTLTKCAMGSFSKIVKHITNQLEPGQIDTGKVSTSPNRKSSTVSQRSSITSASGGTITIVDRRRRLLERLQGF